MSQPHCYATRLVNPYTGVLQVIDDGIARGLSRDGFHWEIQVQAERGAGGWGSLNRNQLELNYYRLGYWNPAHGLRRMPIDPSLDIDQLRAGSEALLRQLQSELLECLPFPLEDRYELWLLDRQQMPLALLGSTCDERLIPQIRDKRWHAVSASLAIDDYPHKRTEPLESLIRLSSDSRQWFDRGPNGEAIGLEYPASADLAGRVLQAAAFPELLVRNDWEDPQASRLVGEWYGYLAPWLLQLQGISEPVRSLLENTASRNPEMVDVLHRLYPLVIDQQLINTLRVTAKIKTASE